jgi:hypothetical protein
MVFLVSLESSGQWWVHGLGSMTLGLEVQKFLNDFFTENSIKLNCSWKFWRNWNVTLMLLLESSWWSGFNENLFGKIWIQNVGISIFKLFLPLKIQINSPKKPGFGRKNQLRMW